MANLIKTLTASVCVAVLCFSFVVPVGSAEGDLFIVPTAQEKPSTKSALIELRISMSEGSVMTLSVVDENYHSVPSSGWTSSNMSVLHVNEEGQATALREGSVTVSATSEVGHVISRGVVVLPGSGTAAAVVQEEATNMAFVPLDDFEYDNRVHTWKPVPGVVSYTVLVGLNVVEEQAFPEMDITAFTQWYNESADNVAEAEAICTALIEADEEKVRQILRDLVPQLNSVHDSRLLSLFDATMVFQVDEASLNVSPFIEEVVEGLYQNQNPLYDSQGFYSIALVSYKVSD